MGEDRFEMGQKERDRLKVLHEARERQMTQQQAAEQLALTDRHVRRLVARLRTVGDRARSTGEGPTVTRREYAGTSQWISRKASSCPMESAPCYQARQFHTCAQAAAAPSTRWR